MSRSKDKGTKAETGVVGAVRRLVYPHAERRALHGSTDLGDITGTPGVCWEVKGGEAAWNASDGLIDRWLVETELERRNAGADIGILVVQRRGISPANAHRWPAYLRLRPLVELARGEDARLPVAMQTEHDYITVRLGLESVCSLLVAAGYGTGPEVIA